MTGYPCFLPSILLLFVLYFFLYNEKSIFVVLTNKKWISIKLQ